MKEFVPTFQKFRFLLFAAIAALSLLIGSSVFAQNDGEGTQSGLARIQIIHLAPFADEDTAVDIHVNGHRVLRHVNYLDSTNYLYITTGSKLIEIFPVGSSTPAISANVTIERNKYYTAIAVGDGVNRPLELIALEDDLSHPPAGQAKVRLGHLAPFADTLAGTTADVRLQDGTVILNDVQFGTIDNSFSVVLDEGEYDLKITTPDGETTLIDPLPFELEGGDILSAYAIGDGVNQDLGVYAVFAGHRGVSLPLASYVYVAHLAPFASGADSAVNVAVNHEIILEDFRYGDSTGYVTLPAGEAFVQILDPNHSEIFGATLDLAQATFYSLYAIGDLVNQPFDVKVLVDDNSAPPAGSAKIRLGHLAPFADTLAGTTADVRLQDGTVVLDDVQFGTVDNTYSVVLPAGTYDLKITTPDGATTLIDPAPITVNDGDIVTALATGEGNNQDLAVFAIVNGDEGFFVPAAEQARLYVAHLAPFAADAAVTVRVNGADALTNINYGDSTGYLEFEAGTYDIDIVPNGATDPAISGSVTLEPGVDYTAIAVGDGANQPLDLIALEDDNSAPPAGSAKLRIGHLAPFADTLAGTTADIRLQDGTVVLDDVQFGTIDTDYSVVLPAGTYDLKVTTPDGIATLIDPEPVALNDGDILSVFATGEGSNQDLGIFAIINGAPGVFLPLEIIQPGTSRLYLAHLAPFASDAAVKINIDGLLSIDNVEYGDYTGYLNLPSGTYDIEVIPAGASSPAIAGEITLVDGQDQTAFAIGDGANQPLGLAFLTDDNSAPPAGSAKLRIGHLAPFADSLAGTTADVRLQDGTVVLDDVQFGTIDNSYSVVLPAGTYDLKITTPDGSTTLIDPAPVTVNDGDIVTALATGEGVNQDLALYVIVNGLAGQFVPAAEPARLYVAHLAPFAADAAVTVRVNGADALTNINYGDSTGYLEFEAGVYDIDIVPNGATDPAISGSVTLEPGVDYTAIAVGDGANQPLDLIALEDDNSAPPAGSAKLRIGHLAPFADTLAGTTADIRLEDGTVVLDDVQFGTIDTDYSVVLPAGTYDLKVTTPDGSTTLIDPEPVALNDGDILSVFATGEGSNQDLGIFAIINGAPGIFLPLTPPTAALQVVHLAPFASDPADTEVFVNLRGETVVDSLFYGESTDFLTVDIGPADVEIFPIGATEPAIADEIELLKGKGYIATAIGNGTIQPLKLLVVELQAPPPGYVRMNFGHTMIGSETEVDLRLDDGTVLLDNVSYGEIDSSLVVPAGRYDMMITTADGSEVLFNAVPMTLEAGQIVTALTLSDISDSSMEVMMMDENGMRMLVNGIHTMFMPIINR